MADISKSVKKVDHEEKCSGQALYVSDYQFPEMNYARTLRSRIAKGIIQSIEFPPLPSGVTIVDYRDIPGKNIVKIIYDDQVIFPEKQVTYLGEPILLVVGPDKAVVDAILHEITVDYIEETPVFAWEHSAVHYHFTKGNPDKAFSSGFQEISFDYDTGYQEQAYIEPQGFIGTYEAGKVTLIGSIQCPYYVKNALIQALGMEENRIRVIQATVGGAFGGKEEFPSLLAAQLAVALMKVKKPIKMIYEREEDMISTTKRHPSKTTLTAVINPDHHIVGLKALVGIDGGANIGLSGVVLSRALIAATGAYTIENVDVTGDVYLTNTVPNGAFRGFGAPQMLLRLKCSWNISPKHSRSMHFHSASII